MRSLLVLSLLVLLALSAGCWRVAAVGALYPVPVIELPPQGARLGIGLENVPDSISIELSNPFTGASGGGRHAVVVSDWHTSLRNAFRAGLGRAFPRLPDDDPAPTLSLQVLQAQVDVERTAISRSIESQVHLWFRCHLVNASGRVVGRSSGVVTSGPYREAVFGAPTDYAVPLQDALERMVEQVAKDTLAP